ncbi:MAG: hypothetical protein AAFY60_13410, partial [Myxococcota bacterium]
MDLERVSVALRPRSSWESIDLGLQLVRRFALPVYLAWFAAFVPLLVLVHGVLIEEPAVAFVLMWWLRPLLDRAVLWVLGPAVFGAAPRPKDILWRWPRFVADLFASPMQLVASLTWRRFSPWRSYLLPVDVLERLALGARRERVAVLARTHRDVASGLTTLCVALEGTLYLAGIFFVALLVPESQQFDIWEWLFSSEDSAARWAHVLFLAAAHCVVEPLFVAGGFGLYLNRRIELEGWDLELAFRRLVSRRSPALLAGVLAAFFVLPAHAQSEGAAKPQKAIERVLEGEEFSDFEEEWVWRWKRPPEEEVEEYDPEDEPDLSVFGLLGKAFAK